MNSTEIYTNEYLKFWQRQFSDKINWLFNEFDVYFETWEDDFFETINNHEDLFNTNQIVSMLRDAFIPLIIPLITIIIALFTLFVIPRCCYIQICRSRRSINEFKHAWFFGVKIFLTLNIIALLLAFTTASMQSSLSLEAAIRNNINSANNYVDELHNEKAKFELQLHEVNKSVITTMLSIRNMINNVPRNIFDSLQTHIGSELNTAVTSCNLIMSKKDLLINRSGLKNHNGSIQNIMEINLKLVQNFVEKFNQNTETLTAAIKMNKYVFDETNKQNLLYDLNVIRNYLKNIRGHYHYPNWILMYRNLQDIYSNLMPEMYKSLDFLDEYPIKIKNNIQHDIGYIYNATDKFKNETELIIEHLLKITRNIYHDDLRQNVRKLLNVSTCTLYAINRNYSLWNNETYFSSLLIATPSIHGFICAISILLLCIAIVYQVKCNGRNFIIVSKFKTCTTILMKLIILFALSLLWTGLVLAAICYIGALSLSMICRPIMTDHLYTKYTDNTQVWNNKTWLDHIVYPWHHNYKLKDILERCSHNITVYQAFEVEKYWKVSDLFENNEINLNKEDMINRIKRAINSVTKPNGEICNIAKNEMNAVEKEITLLSPHIMYDVETLQSNDIKQQLQHMLEKYGIIVELQQMLDIINEIQQIKLDSILSNFMEFKYLLKSQQNELTTIEKMDHQIVDKLNKNIYLLVKNKLNNTTKTINSLLNDLEEHLSHQIVNEIGNCYIYPQVIERTKEKACIEMPLLFNMTWILLSFSAIFLLLSTFFCCQLCNSINEIRNERKIWLEKLEFDKLSNRRKRLLSGTLLFDRSGRFMGDSRTLLAQDAPEALIIHPEATVR